MNSSWRDQIAWAILVLSSAAHGAAAPPRQISGHYQVVLRLPPDGLFADEEMQIEFRVEDTALVDPVAGFTPVIRASPEAVIDMPAMPSMPKFSELAHPEGTPGDYGIHPTFAHGGDFRLRLAIHPLAGQAFTVEFPLVVQDAESGRKRKPQPARFSLEVSAQPARPKAGEPVEMRFTVRDRDNANAVATAFETVHEALMHLVIVRRDLTQFAHEHPVPQPDGSFQLRYTFPAGGDYRLFADVAPKAAGSQILGGRLNVSGSPKGPPPPETGNCRITRDPPNTAFPARKTVPVVFAIADAQSGKPVDDLEPYLGALGHLMVVHEDASSFVHAHPDETGSETGAGRIRFLARFPKPGLYRGWIQIRRGGKVLTADFLFQASDAHE